MRPMTSSDYAHIWDSGRLDKKGAVGWCERGIVLITTITVVMPTTTANSHPAATSTRGVLLIGASRGLGLALAEEWARSGWHVTATVRSTDRTGLHDLADRYREKIEIESVDITVPEQIAALHSQIR